MRNHMKHRTHEAQLRYVRPTLKQAALGESFCLYVMLGKEHDDGTMSWPHNVQRR